MSGYAGSILKVKVASPKWDAILVAINKQINANSNEASWASPGAITRAIFY